MATTVLLPKFGNSVESSIIVRWLKQVGDAVAVGEPLCEVETDKATMEVPSPAAGILLEQCVAVGDDVPVQTPIAVVGEQESVRAQYPRQDRGSTPPQSAPPQSAPPQSASTFALSISPRARGLASQLGIDLGQLVGSGPGGRIIERDVQSAIQSQPKLTPLAKAMVEKSGFVPPTSGSGPGGRVLGRDLLEQSLSAEREISGEGSRVVIDHDPSPAIYHDPTPSGGEGMISLPLTGTRRIIAKRMLTSLQTTAQLTLHRTADARQLQALRQRFKASPASLGLQGITINDLLLYAVARSLLQHPQLNALFRKDTIEQYEHVQLGIAVDTPRGLLVPVIRNANSLSLRAISQEARRLADVCLQGKAAPDQLSGGTFTISNLGNLGIESFTPILNAPQVAILGVGSIVLKPIESEAGVQFIPHVNLSLTINHQVVDGAPAARFLQQLAEYIANLDLVLAL
jgi:pyruvate dehydrogenase E2 component (dihydrolipoamide acetyltransferase)